MLQSQFTEICPFSQKQVVIDIDTTRNYYTIIDSKGNEYLGFASSKDLGGYAIATQNGNFIVNHFEYKCVFYADRQGNFLKLASGSEFDKALEFWCSPKLFIHSDFEFKRILCPVFLEESEYSHEAENIQYDDSGYEYERSSNGGCYSYTVDEHTIKYKDHTFKFLRHTTSSDFEYDEAKGTFTNVTSKDVAFVINNQVYVTKYSMFVACNSSGDFHFIKETFESQK